MRSLTLVSRGRLQRQPDGAENAHRGEQQQRRHRRDPGLSSARASVDQHGRAGEDRNRQERHAPQPDQRSGLRQRQRLRQRVAERIPWKSGQQMAAQPFADRQADRERQHARGVAGPEQARQRKADRGEQREIGGQAEHRERHQPGKGRCIDQEGVADPVKPRHEIAEPEPEAGHRRRRHAAPFSGRRAVDQPDRDRKGQEQHRPCIERRHRERRQRAGHQRDGGALPSPGQDDRKTGGAEFAG